jgi:mono/diheme cytochrome c family protein
MTRRRTDASLALALAAGAGGCLSDPPPRDPSQWPITRVEIERAIPTDDPAELTYRAHCIACHGVDGRGAGGSTGANFTAPDGPLTRPDEALLVSILEGRRGEIGIMPAHREVLGVERARAVLGYIRTRFGAGIEVIVPATDDAAVTEGADAGVGEAAPPTAPPE